jgi:hypothetical protein
MTVHLTLSPPAFFAFRTLLDPDGQPDGASATWVEKELAKLEQPASSVIPLLTRARDREWVTREIIKRRKMTFLPAITLDQALTILLRDFLEAYHLTSPEDLARVLLSLSTIVNGEQPP